MGKYFLPHFFEARINLISSAAKDIIRKLQDKNKKNPKTSIMKIDAKIQQDFGKSDPLICIV